MTTADSLPVHLRITVLDGDVIALLHNGGGLRMEPSMARQFALQLWKAARMAEVDVREKSPALARD